MQDEEYHAKAWGHQSILNFFDKRRLTTQDIYPSEWLFIKKNIRESISILDIGCAKGGMANVLSEHLQDFNYVGVDINAEMITAAKKRYSQHQFHLITESDYSCLGANQFDLVLCLGILHLHEAWRETIQTAWQHTKGCLILDLRETHLQSIEDKTISYFKMDFDHPDQPAKDLLPYNIINTSEAFKVIRDTCREATKITHYGYTHQVSQLAVCPMQEIMANVYCIER